jgi:hypothetical protein
MYLMKRNAVLVAAIGLSLVIPAPVFGQAVDTASTRALLAELRASGNRSAILARLTQEYRNRPTAELDALADSLVTIATSYRKGDPLTVRRAALSAAVAIATSASPGHLAERANALQARGIDRTPVPYHRAFEALARIYRESPDSGARAGTLYLMTQLPDSRRVVAFLAEVAVSPTTLSIPAIRHLVSDMGEPGLAVLRRLYQTDAVVQQTAREHLEGIAIAQGWTGR